MLRKAHHFGITPTFVPSFTKFIRFFNIKNIYKIKSEFNFYKILYTKKVNSMHDCAEFYFSSEWL